VALVRREKEKTLVELQIWKIAASLDQKSPKFYRRKIITKNTIQQQALKNFGGTVA
jgi:hypothetical protein